MAMTRDFPLDQIVINQLPAGTIVHSCTHHGSAAWTNTARIETTLANGESKLYFLKCAEGDQGKAMLEGEFHSMCELYKISPDFVPRPYTWGKLSTSKPDSDQYYFLCDFIKLANQMPAADPFSLCTKLANLHQKSKSPTGKFGFHVNTCQGNLPQQTAWNESWMDFYIQLMKGAMQLNRDRNGPWKNLEQVVDRLITKVVPQLLGPLEANGKRVKPCLIHGDLWDQNIGTDVESSEVYVFDAAAYYAHNEMEIAMWRGKFNKMVASDIYTDTYLAIMGKSEPAEQFDDRGKLYSSYMLLHESACHHGSSFRRQCYETMNSLLAKYAPFGPGESGLPK
ncbi:hypothetical protein K491DRAFT_702468 [Lophiostoma macrostomum CBS 122681]|uniref:protein-ribulosamine 3-kinase n=1 Tax=Lophiostoma macrostomum CBS 122681 TaxID=1314788 RepID=A0A6A6TG23_9PLEO|nr:hypothetical protein K491DRAFT_702468 [Lophiostoma macrostomum CBS 122681]